MHEERRIAVRYDDIRLPERSVLVHVGPPKTGTTSIQASLEQHRGGLLAHDVRYPGSGLRHRDAARALRGFGPRGTPAPPAGAWDALVEEVRESAEARVCVSAEELVAASPEQVRRLVDDLGPDRVHVLIVVRRLDRILPSQWQQRVRDEEVEPYDRWLAGVLAEELEGRTGAFWKNNGVARMVEGWRTGLPADRVSLLVLDEHDRTQLMRTFEALLGLPQGLLTPGPRENPSLSYDRVELYRRINVIAEERGWDDGHRRALLNRGLLAGLRAGPPNASEQSSPPMPAWAWPRVVALSDARVEEVRASGVRVIGDPEWLKVEAPDDPEDPDGTGPPETVACDAVALGVAEMFERAVERERRIRRGPRPVATPGALTRLGRRLRRG